jgi:hypothetical protein
LDDTAEALIGAEEAQRDLTAALHSSISKAQRARDAQAKYEEVLERVTEDEIITTDEAWELAEAIAGADAAAANVSAVEYSTALAAMRDATGNADSRVVDLMENMDRLDGRQATAHASVKVNRSGLRSAEEVIEQFNRVTQRRIKVDIRGIMPSQATIDRAVARSLRGWGRIGGR